jgi:hypothetical protein
MFGPEAPPLPWDEEGCYTRARIELFFCAFAGSVLKEAQIVEVLQHKFPEGYVETGCQVPPPPALYYAPIELLIAKFATSMKHIDAVQLGRSIVVFVSLGMA